MNAHEPLNEPLSLAFIWTLLGAALFLILVLIYFSPRLMSFLDRLADRRHARKSKRERQEDENNVPKRT